MSNVYAAVISKVSPYMGPTAERFISRQCRAHLKIEPDSLNESHLPELARWVKTSASLLIGTQKAEELRDEILSLV